MPPFDVRVEFSLTGRISPDISDHAGDAPGIGEDLEEMAAPTCNRLADPWVSDAVGEDFRSFLRFNREKEPEQVRKVLRPQPVSIAPQLGRVEPIMDLARFRTQQCSRTGHICVNGRTRIERAEREPLTIEEAQFRSVGRGDGAPAVHTNASGSDVPIRGEAIAGHRHRGDQIDAVPVMDAAVPLRDRRPHPGAVRTPERSERAVS